MKKFLTAISLIIFTLSLVSCEDEQEREISVISETAELVDTESADDTPVLQECRSSITLAANQAVTGFSLSATCSGDIKTHAKVADVKKPDSDIAGDFGVSVKLVYEDIEKPVISFDYDKKQLYGMPEENFIVLRYVNGDYSECKTFIDSDNGKVSAEIETDGTYVLADIYQWYDYIGEDNSEYEYFSYKDSKWLRDYDTGDIMELADIGWAVENAPDFHVSTPEQLASVVLYSNTSLMTKISLTLEDDIDLTGYEWKSMCWRYEGEDDNKQRAFRGLVEGNGHTINGMTIHEEGCYNVGFLGFAINTTMQNINFTNADVSADYVVGIAGGYLYANENAGVEWKNVHVSGKITAYDEYGAIAGFGDKYWYVPFTDCTADVTANGEPFEYLTYYEKEEADRIALQDTFTITLHDDGTITKDDHEGFINLKWSVSRNGLDAGVGADAVESPVYSIDEAINGYNDGKPGKYEICLTGRTDPNKSTQRVSNVIEYTVDKTEN